MLSFTKTPNYGGGTHRMGATKEISHDGQLNKLAALLRRREPGLPIWDDEY